MVTISPVLSLLWRSTTATRAVSSPLVGELSRTCAVFLSGADAAAVSASDGSSSFLYFWDGQSWHSVGKYRTLVIPQMQLTLLIDSTLDGNTEVSQLTMVPLQNTHDGNGVIEPDRVLMVSGTLSDSSFGNASSALFDGQTLIPYIVSTSDSGSPGSVSSLFHSFKNFSFNQRRACTSTFPPLCIR